jgi:hypothetical protein
MHELICSSGGIILKSGMLKNSQKKQSQWHIVHDDSHRIDLGRHKGRSGKMLATNGLVIAWLTINSNDRTL